MSTQTRELLHLCDQLPEDKQIAVADFARFLLARSMDDAWDATLDAPHPPHPPHTRPRLDAYLEESAQEPAQPLDLDRL